MSRAAIAQVEGVSWNTADRWLSRAKAFTKCFTDRKTRGIELIELQADEIRTFAPEKTHPTWIFTTMAVCSRLWVSTVVGCRRYRNTRVFLIDTLARSIIVGTPLLATHGFKFYARVIRRLFGPACNYGQVIKTWRNCRVVKVERRPVIGTRQRLDEALESSEDSVSLNTAYIERLNLTVRQSVAYLARRTPN